MIPHFKVSINSEDKCAVSAVLSENIFDYGKIAKNFETQFAQWIGCSLSGVSVSNASDAILLALQTIGVTSDDEIILPSYTSVNNFRAVLASGAKPVLCDVGPNWVIEPSNISGLITKNTKAIIVPHAYGIFANVREFKKFNINIIENCAEALGDITIDKIEGDLAVFSFGLTGCLTTIEGGMLVTNNADWQLKAREIRDKKNPEKSFYPLSDLHAALGLSQLKRYPFLLEQRRKIAGRYIATICKISQRLINFEAKARSMYLGLPIRVEGGISKYENLFSQKGIQITRGIENLNHRIIKDGDERFTMSVDLFNNTISLPLYPAMSEDEFACCLNALSILK